MLGSVEWKGEEKQRGLGLGEDWGIFGFQGSPARGGGVDLERPDLSFGEEPFCNL